MKRGLEEGAGPGDEGEEEEEEEFARPQKRHFRTRAHSNVLNANDFWYPASPAEVPVSKYYPKLAAESVATPPRITQVDVGCGYGSLLLGLAVVFPDELILGIEIRPKIVEYVQKRCLALRHEARTGKVVSEGAAANGVVLNAAAATSGGHIDTSTAAADGVAAPACENLWAVHNNAMRFLPNFFEKEQLTKLYFCFPDPHFKRKNHRKRIITPPLLAEYAYSLCPAGCIYLITDVSELMEWMVTHLTESPLFERLSNEALKADPAVPVLINTDEGQKVQRNNGNMFIAVFRKRLDPLEPREPPPILSNAVAAEAAAQAGFVPKAGGERRGMTW